MIEIGTFDPLIFKELIDDPKDWDVYTCGSPAEGVPYKHVHNTDLVHRVLSHFYKIDQIQLARFNNLKPGQEIKPHTDPHEPDDVFAVHLVCSTNPDTKFWMEKEGLVTMELAHVYEINNNQNHWLNNQGDTDRIHLFVLVKGKPLKANPERVTMNSVEHNMIRWLDPWFPSDERNISKFNDQLKRQDFNISAFETDGAFITFYITQLATDQQTIKTLEELHAGHNPYHYHGKDGQDRINRRGFGFHYHKDLEQKPSKEDFKVIFKEIEERGGKINPLLKQEIINYYEDK